MGMIHLVDWFATFLSLAGLDPIDTSGPSSSDGINMWPWLQGAVAASPRNVIVYDNLILSGQAATGAIRVDNYKLLVGSQPLASWFGGAQNNYFSSNTSNPDPDTSATACSLASPCLFDLSVDPTEHNDLSGLASSASIMSQMRNQWNQLSSTYHPPYPPKADTAYCTAAAANNGYLKPYE